VVRVPGYEPRGTGTIPGATIFSPVIAISTHPVWLIDEYVKIFRSDVWFIPPVDPTSTDVNIINSVWRFSFSKYDVKIIGAAFCIVISNKQFIHLNPSIILGNNQCNGAAPILIKSGVVIAYEWGSLSLASAIEELFEIKSRGSVGIRHADHVAPSIRKKLTLTSPTSFGRSVGIVRSRNQATEFVVVCYRSRK
jgi:hypothetical protein